MEPLDDTGTAQRLSRFIATLKASGDERYGSDASIARAVGIAPEVLLRYKKGKRKPGLEILSDFARLGLSLDWLVHGGDDSMMFYRPEQRRDSAESTARAVASTLPVHVLAEIIASKAAEK